MRDMSRMVRRGAWLLLAALAPVAGAHQAEEGFAGDSDVQAFITEMVRNHGFERDRLEALLAEARPQPAVLSAISRPAEARPWHEYRPIFLTRARILAGAAFWDSHAAVLQRALQRFGVPPEIVVAIIGVETRYGARTGGIRVLDALATLAFRYPRRSGFFRSELEQYLLLVRQEELDPLALRGSYAGAMGLPQFIASSYRRYAVDFDGDGRRDLLDDPDDAIGSVANYLAEHGWRRGEPIAAPAQVDGAPYRELLGRGLKPQIPIGEMKARGLRIDAALPDSQPGALIELETGDGYEYWVGLENFYAITRYNHSALYAMAVYQLAQAIREARRNPVEPR